LETKKMAATFGVYGWVRNKRDGTVESVIEGDEKDVTSLINWCKSGPPLSRVQMVDVAWQDYQGEFGEFRIRY
jgi:acylphosphatase